MILRRVISHFRKQEWTAIAIDFVIVVTGVFIGIQVANWNDARKEAAWERAFLRDMLAELQENRAQLATIATFQTEKSEALDEMRALLDRELTGEARAEIERKFFFAQSSNKTFFPTKGVYLSALSSGRVDQIGDKEIKYAVMNLYEHFFTRLVYNGEIYDERVDQVTWDLRRIVDVAGDRLRGADAIGSEDFRADIDFLAAQSRIYATLANDNLAQTDKLIASISAELGDGGA